MQGGTMIKKITLIASVLVIAKSMCMEKAQSAENFDAQQVYERALAYMNQSESEQDKQHKEALHQQFMKCLFSAAEHNHKDAQKKLACVLYNVSIVTPAISEKIMLLDQALTQGINSASSAEEKFQIARMYDEKRKWIFNDKQIKFCKKQALKWLIDAAQAGHVGAQAELGFHLYTKSVEKRKQKKKRNLLDQGLYWLKSAADNGDLGAENNLGKHYYGLGIESNDIQESDAALLTAEQCFERALASQEVAAYALYNLGVLHKYKARINDNQSEVHLDKALKYFLQAIKICSEDKKKDICCLIAETYEKKYRIASADKQDAFLDLALLWYEKSAFDLKKQKMQVNLYDKKLDRVSEPQQKILIIDKIIQVLTRITPKPTDVQERLAVSYWQKACLVGDFQEKEKLLLTALEIYLEILPEMKHLIRYHKNLGFIYRQLGDCAFDAKQKRARLVNAVKCLRTAANQGYEAAISALAEIKSEVERDKGCVQAAH